MIKVDFKFNAKEFERKVMKAAQDAITKRVRRVRCPIHGQIAKVVPKTSGGKISWDISGCCEKLVEKVRTELK